MRPTTLELRFIGPLSVVRDGVPVELPRSRKVLLLLAYLALEGGEHTRSRLCDLLWDGPNDPRGELRWGLSKLRALVDDGERRRVVAPGNALVALDVSDAFVDTKEAERALAEGLGSVATSRLVELLDAFRGDLLEGVEIDGSAELRSWLGVRRQRFRALRVALAQELAARPAATPEDATSRVGRWLELAPLDRAAHQAMLAALVRAGRACDAEEHLSSAIRLLEQEGIDWSPLQAFWRDARKTASVQAVSASAAAESSEVLRSMAPEVRRASVAVMPFFEIGTARGEASDLAHGLTDDIITRLAKLRALFVIARGTTYALSERDIEAREAGRILRVQYVVSGRIRRQSERVGVLVELSETRSACIVWTDELVCEAAAAFEALDAIVNKIVATVAEEIEAAECSRAMLLPPSSLDAWEAYHRGLWHMYKFRNEDNLQAEGFFRAALRLDPTFARAYAGLSFTHFQNVFLELSADRERQIQLALEAAESSVAADERDPAAHWAMGRALWLRGSLRESLAELGRSVELSPNFALGHYTLGFVEAQSGDPHSAIRACDTSRELSPFDPLQFGMLASRAVAHMRLEQYAEAAEWSVKAVARPNAHGHIVAIAASALGLAGRRDEAQALIARLRERVPSYGVEHFLRAFRFDRDTEMLIRRSATAVGL